MGVCESQNEIPNKIPNDAFKVRTKYNKIKVSSKYFKN